MHLAVTKHTIVIVCPPIKKQKNMKIFKALGWGLFIVIIRNTMPEVFNAFRDTLTTFFSLANKILESGPPSLNI